MTWHDYVINSISIIPIKLDGSKGPAIPAWKQYQSERADEATMVGWFDSDDPFDTEPKAGIAAVCGAISGNLLCIDFDDPDAFHPWAAEVVVAGLSGLLDIAPIVNTPSDGCHVWLRCEGPVGKNQKLAYDAAKKVRIETRGEGGYALVPGCPAACHSTGKLYELASGSFDTIPVLSIEQLDILLDAARDLDEYQEQAVKSAARVPAGDYDDAPGTTYNQNGNMRALLERHGWKLVRTHGETEFWRRPGKNEGISATFNFKGCGCFYPFSSNAAPFESERSYTPFGVLATLEHAGDYTAAATSLIAGQPMKQLKLNTTKKSPEYAPVEPRELSDDDETADTADDGSNSPVAAFINAMIRTLDEGIEPEHCWELWNLLDDAQRVSARFIARSRRRIDDRTLNSVLDAGMPKETPVDYTPEEILNCDEAEPKELPLLGCYGYNAWMEGYCHLIVSSPRTGKSELTAQCVAGWGKPVIYLSEESKQTWRIRLRVMKACGLSMPEGSKITPCAAGSRQFILDKIEGMNPGEAMVIDTLRSYFAINDECDAGQINQAILPLIKAARKAAITLVVIHHARKSGGGDAIEAASGNNALTGHFDTVLFLEQKGEHLKLNGKLRGGVVHTALLHWEDNLLKIIDPITVKRLSIKDKVLEAVPTYDFIDIDGIVDALGEDAPAKVTLKRRLVDLVEDGKIRTEKDISGGKYSKQRWTRAGTETLDE